MTAGDAFLLVVRWLHVLSAVLWVGGGAFYLIVLRPAARAGGPAGAAVQSRAGQEFGVVVNTAILVLVLTGAVLAFDRLTEPRTTVGYVVVLAVKVALSVWMFFLAHGRLRGRRPLFGQASMRRGNRGLDTALRALTWTNLVVVLGVVVFLLSDLLRAMVELALRQPG